MTKLHRVLVPMPAFTNPNNPLTQSGSINLDLGKHPVEHAESFGGVDAGERDVVLSVADTHAQEMAKGDVAVKKVADAVVESFPENREDWQKKHWQAKAREYNLATSGNIDAVSSRVEEYEDDIEVVKEYNAGAWQDALVEVETEDDLKELRGLYDRSGTEFSTVVSAFDARQSEFDNEK